MAIPQVPIDILDSLVTADSIVPRHVASAIDGQRA